MPTLEGTAAASPGDGCEQGNAPVLPGECQGAIYEINGKRIIDSADLFIAGASFTAIVGPNGAGKSTMIRLLHGLLSPTGGRITWGGQLMSRAVRARQAMVFQRPVLLRRSVRANLQFVLHARGRQDPQAVDDWLTRTGLSQRARQPARALSGGEQQRLALARALALEPQVLFLDEPTASLDPAATTAIETLIRDAHISGTTIVLVTHDMGQARRLAQDVAVMNHGKVLEHTPAAEFFRQPRTATGADFLAGRLVF